MLKTIGNKYGIQMTYTEVGYDPNYDNIQINNYDVVLLSVYNSVKQNMLGDFLDKCISNGINVVQIMFNNSNMHKAYPKG